MAMDPGTILAVSTASLKVSTLLWKYYSDVKDAKDDIQRLAREAEAFRQILEKLKTLGQGQSQTRLLATSSFIEAMQQSLSIFKKLEERLDPGTGTKAMRRFGIRALKWPLTRNEVDKLVKNLEGFKATLSLVLSHDEM